MLWTFKKWYNQNCQWTTGLNLRIDSCLMFKWFFLLLEKKIFGTIISNFWTLCVIAGILYGQKVPFRKIILPEVWISCKRITTLNENSLLDNDLFVTIEWIENYWTFPIFYTIIYYYYITYVHRTLKKILFCVYFAKEILQNV